MSIGLNKGTDFLKKKSDPLFFFSIFFQCRFKRVVSARRGKSKEWVITEKCIKAFVSAAAAAPLTQPRSVIIAKIQIRTNTSLIGDVLSYGREKKLGEIFLLLRFFSQKFRVNFEIFMQWRLRVREALIREKKILEISTKNIILNEKKKNSHFDADDARMPAA